MLRAGPSACPLIMPTACTELGIPAKPNRTFTEPIVPFRLAAWRLLTAALRVIVLAGSAGAQPPPGSIVVRDEFASSRSYRTRRCRFWTTMDGILWRSRRNGRARGTRGILHSVCARCGRGNQPHLRASRATDRRILAVEFPGCSGDAARFVGGFELLRTEPPEVAVTSRSIVEGIDVVTRHIICTVY
jgi:hypothetical protein